MTVVTKPQADLKTRLISAVFMILGAGSAIWAGGNVFLALAILIGLGLCWEWWGLASKVGQNVSTRALLFLAGVTYIVVAVWALIALRTSVIDLVAIVGCVIATDTGAYFAGRAIGGPKIAPSISPSKTWSGLGGGMIASAITMTAIYGFSGLLNGAGLVMLAILGALLAIVAQAGDFLESAMKRRAGVKDSSHLIPGHGGLLDRLDGLLAVAAVFGTFKILIG